MDGTVKSDQSIIVLHHFGLGHTIGFQAAVSDISDGKHPESSGQLTSRCLQHIVTLIRQVSCIYGAWCGVRGIYIHFGDVMTAQAKPIRHARSRQH